MTAPHTAGEGGPPEVILTSPSFGPKSKARKLFKLNSRGDEESRTGHSLNLRTVGGPSKEKHVQLQEGPVGASSSIYMGSYKHSPRHSRTSLSGLARSREGSVAPSARASISQIHIDHLLQNLDLGLETYGVEEFRDGFFDGLFLKPPQSDLEELMKMAEDTLPAAFRKRHPLSPAHFLPKQWHEIKGAVRRITKTRAGVQLSRSFLAFLITYIFCLVPVIGDWIGNLRYIMVISAIINHPGRTIGAQIDGAILTILGTATGLGWGAFALYLSDSSFVASSGYGGILAAFLIIFMGTIAAVRSFLIRLYQFVLCAGISVIYTCLADTSRTVAWKKLLDYGIPWLLGQAICLVVCCTIFPDAGARPLAVALHDALACMQEALKFPRADVMACHRQLAWTFVNLSQAYRDLVLDMSVTRFLPADIASLRNLMQAVLRSMLALTTETDLFDDLKHVHLSESEKVPTETVVDIESSSPLPVLKRIPTEEQALRIIVDSMSGPTGELLSSMREALSRCDAVLLDMSSYRKYLGPPEDVSSDIDGILTKLRKAMTEFDAADESLLENNQLPSTYSNHPEVVKLFLFINPVRQTADSIETLLVKVEAMKQRNMGWRVYLPSYPLRKSLQRTNAQVRHDRGGVTAGYFFHSQNQLNKLMHDLQKSTYRPLPRQKDLLGGKPHEEECKEDDNIVMDREITGKKSYRYGLWRLLHRLQGFETRFALKVSIVTVLLAVPAWLEQSSYWYNQYSSFWSVIMVWLMMHPRVGGNFQDLVTRSLCCVIGAAWGGFSYAAGNGNPYVMAVFAVIYMVPMLYRFTRSTHPRSGIVGCISFAVVSLDAYTKQGSLPIVTLSLSLGLAFVVGVVSAVVVNWILWPFVARHELRKSISAMLFHSAIIYRGIVSKYIYYEAGQAPGEEDVARSELLEGRLREGFVRIRQLMALTRHELRLRGPFNPLPYSALIENCETFFEHLVEVRQASLFFHPNYMSDNIQASEALLPFRRDAVAAILMNLYTLAGALRGNRKVPKYLPSAAAARKKLLDKMAELEMEHANAGTLQGLLPKKGVGRRFAEVYQFAYSQALTQCVEVLENMQKYTKAICGEEGFDPIYEDESDETKLMTSAGLDGNTSH